MSTATEQRTDTPRLSDERAREIVGAGEEMRRAQLQAHIWTKRAEAFAASFEAKCTEALYDAGVYPFDGWTVVLTPGERPEIAMRAPVVGEQP